MEDVEEMMKKELFKNFDKPITAYRLGPKDSAKNRSIKLNFRDESEKWSFLKRSNTLRTEKIFCKLDLTKETRDKEYQLREKIYVLRAESEHTKYRMKDLKIQQKNGMGNWEELKTATPIITTDQRNH